MLAIAQMGRWGDGCEDTKCEVKETQTHFCSALFGATLPGLLMVVTVHLPLLHDWKRVTPALLSA